MKICSQGRITIWMAWLLAILWNGFITFALVASWIDHPDRFWPKTLSDLVPVPFIGMISIISLWYAISTTKLRILYGDTYFVSDSNGFSLGDRLQGKIEFGLPLRSPHRQFRLTLLYEMRGPKNANYTVWRDSNTVVLTPDGTIPVRFDLPSTIPSNPIVTSFADSFWYLKVKEIKGGFKSFAASYILPTGETPTLGKY